MGRRVLIPYQIGQTYSVSTLTTLISSFDLRLVRAALLSLQNPDGANEINLLCDPSAGGVKFNTGRRQTAIAAPGEECQIEIQPENLYPYIRASAQTDSPGFPTVTGVTFELRIEPESDGIAERFLRQNPTWVEA